MRVHWKLTSAARRDKLEMDIWVKEGASAQKETAYMVLFKGGVGGIGIQSLTSQGGGGSVQVMVATPNGRSIWSSDDVDTEGMDISVLLYLGKLIEGT